MAVHTEVTDNSFDEEILASDKPVLVDFWAEWCGPCKMIAPVLDEIAAEHAEDLRVVKLNVDDNLRTAQRFEVMSIPTLMLFKNGEVQVRVVGAKSKSALLADIEPHFRGSPLGVRPLGSDAVSEALHQSAEIDVGSGTMAGWSLDLQFRLTELDSPPPIRPACSGPPPKKPSGRSSPNTRWTRPAASTVTPGMRSLKPATGSGSPSLPSSAMLRGDDVGELQRRLSALGFDPARSTRSSATTPCAPSWSSSGTRAYALMASAVERYSIISTASSSARGPVIWSLRCASGSERSNGSPGRSQNSVSPWVSTAGSPLPSSRCADSYVRLAPAQSNSTIRSFTTSGGGHLAKVDCYVGLRIVPDQANCMTAYYRGFSYESATSRRLAEIVQSRLPLHLGVPDGGTLGIALPILRETEMPAIEIQLGTPTLIVQRTADLARMLVEALNIWVVESPA